MSGGASASARVCEALLAAAAVKEEVARRRAARTLSLKSEAIPAVEEVENARRTAASDAVLESGGRF